MDAGMLCVITTPSFCSKKIRNKKTLLKVKIKEKIFMSAKILSLKTFFRLSPSLLVTEKC
jgi:hypothetical protein